MVHPMQDTTIYTTPKPTFKQMIKDGDLRLHPIVPKLVDNDVLEKMGAKQIVASDMPTEGQIAN
jgi:hypothetical protein